MNTRKTYLSKVSLSTIPARTIVLLMGQFCTHHPKAHRRARKPTYPEQLILTLLLLQNSREASFRQLLYAVAPEALPECPLPSLSAFVYRKGRVGEERLEQLLQWLAQQGIVLEQEQRGDTPALLTMVDGTGVGDNTPLYHRYHRGKEIHRLRSHVKVVGLVYWDGGLRWMVGLSLGEAYSECVCRCVCAVCVVEHGEVVGGAGGEGVVVFVVVVVAQVDSRTAPLDR